MYPHLPARTKVALFPYLILVCVGLFVADDWGLIDLAAAQASPAQVVRPDSQPQSSPTSATARADIPPRYLRLYRGQTVPWNVLAAVGKIESDHGRVPGAKPGGSSSAGALGPMQFMPDTWKTWGRGGNVYDPVDAIPAAARLLDALGVRRNPSWALAAYNAGPGCADHPPASTRRYVTNVRAIARRYAKGA
jgi:soluble lytic murein transglycosylase-like protein